MVSSTVKSLDFDCPAKKSGDETEIWAIGSVFNHFYLDFSCFLYKRILKVEVFT